MPRILWFETAHAISLPFWTTGRFNMWGHPILQYVCHSFLPWFAAWILHIEDKWVGFFRCISSGDLMWQNLKAAKKEITIDQRRPTAGHECPDRFGQSRVHCHLPSSQKKSCMIQYYSIDIHQYSIYDDGCGSVWRIFCNMIIVIALFHVPIPRYIAPAKQRDICPHRPGNLQESHFRFNLLQQIESSKNILLKHVEAHHCCPLCCRIVSLIIGLPTTSTWSNWSTEAFVEVTAYGPVTGIRWPATSPRQGNDWLLRHRPNTLEYSNVAI